MGDDLIVVGSSPTDFRRLMDTLAKIPHNGLQTSRKVRRSQHSLMEIHVITSRSEYHPPAYGKNHQQVILIDLLETGPDELGVESTCSCESPWIQLQANQSLTTVLPIQWRKACHVA